MRHVVWFAVATLCVAGPAVAGPCSDQIAGIARTISQTSVVSGAPTTGTLNGAAPGADRKTASAPNAGAQSEQTTAAGGTLGGDSGNREMNRTASNVATSPTDVRRQQAGLPTQADAPGVKSSDEKLVAAKAQLDKARMLDVQNDSSCHSAADAAQKMMGPS